MPGDVRGVVLSEKAVELRKGWRPPHRRAILVSDHVSTEGGVSGEVRGNGNLAGFGAGHGGYGGNGSSTRPSTRLTFRCVCACETEYYTRGDGQARVA